MVRIERLTPHMLRVRFASPDLIGFESAAPDDHVKLFIPVADGDAVMRDYSPRAFDAEAGLLVIDFALHDAGPATAWALATQVGDRLDIGGPRGSNVVADDFDWYLLIGDETALPAIARRLEELRPEAAVRVVVVVDGENDRLPLASAARLEVRWAFREGSEADDATLMREALGRDPLHQGEGYVWIAAEAAIARSLRRHVEELGHPVQWTKASGYWQAAASEPGPDGPAA